MGSEMCIRDRPATGEMRDGKPGGGHGPDPGSGQASASAVALAASCLLYTSDAADERSSVDLGGRRIIKKKKHRYM